jgi:hypothetical protein
MGEGEEGWTSRISENVTLIDCRVNGKKGNEG